MRLNERDIQTALEQIRTAPQLKKIGSEEAERLCKLVGFVLTDYADHFGEETAFEFRIRKRLTGAELRISVSGALYDPLLSGERPLLNRANRLLNNLLVDRATTAFFTYFLGTNIISIRAPQPKNAEGSLKTTLLALVFGVIFGLLATLLPQNARDFLVNSVTSPLSSLLMTVLTGIMAPVIFVSLLHSVTTLNDISELNTLGKRVIRRFALMTMFLAAASILVCYLLFRTTGGTSVTFLPEQIVELFFDMIPTNLVKPFVEGKVPQLIVLALGMGAALLIMGDRANGVKKMIGDTSIWLNTFIRIVNRIAPAITFLNFMSLVAAGKLDTILNAWKYIAGVAACFLVYALWKLCYVSARHSLNPLKLLRKLLPLMKKNFTSVSKTQTMDYQRQTAENVLGVQRSFADFWVPMSYAMLYPFATICCVVSAFFVAQMVGMAVSASFMIVLFILAVQLSLACPGLTGSMVIVFGQLGLPVDYVGVFNACRIITEKIAQFFSSAIVVLEELDAAFAENAVDEAVLRA